MNVETASQHTFIKHNLMLQHAGLFKPLSDHYVVEDEQEDMEDGHVDMIESDDSDENIDWLNDDAL